MVSDYDIITGLPNQVRESKGMVNSGHWSRRTVVLNSLLLYSTALLGAYVLWENSSVVFWLYVSFWVGVLTVGRYFVCRRCSYYGKDCPSFGFSYIVRIFPKDRTGTFSWPACALDISAITLILIMPIIVWILSVFEIVPNYSIINHALMGLYVALTLAMLGFHSVTGCNKCDIAECRLSKAAKERKVMGIER
jgi:hypothetical protein